MEGWKKMALGDIAIKFFSGGTPSTKDSSLWDGDIQWITSKWLNGRLYLNNGEKKITEKGLENSATKLVKARSLILATRVGVGKVSINEIDLAINQDLLGIEIDEKFYSLEFLAYQLRSENPQDYINSFKRGATIQGVTKDCIKSIELNIPPLPEQHKIAHVLSTVQKAIEQQENLIRTTTELKKALMQKLFTEGTRGEPQKETEIGLVPESWEVIHLIDVCEKPQYGFTDSAAKEGNAQFLRITDITEFGVNWNEVPFCNCPDYKNYELKNGDIVFARIGATTGKSYLIKNPPKSVYASYLIRVRCKDKILPEFLIYYFETEQYWSQINARKGDNLKGGVNGSILSKLYTPKPILDEQEQIAGSFMILDKKIAFALSKKQTLTALFKTLLRELMTGQRRVHDIDFEARESQTSL